METINEFGIKPVLLMAQIVNFLILLFLLKKFLFGPILKVLDDRKKKVAESLANAEKIQLELEKTLEERDKKLQLAAKESKKIIDEAFENANQIVDDAHQKARVDIEKMIIKAKEEIILERDKMHQEIRGELADLIGLGMEKVAGKVLNSQDKKNLAANSIKEFES
jgi:F-type H+-transporting ATPase subunit b